MIVMHLNAVRIPETENWKHNCSVWSRFSADFSFLLMKFICQIKTQQCLFSNFASISIISSSWILGGTMIIPWRSDEATVSWLMSWYISSHEHWAAHLTGHWTQQQTGQMLQLWRPVYWRLTRLFVSLLHSVSCVRGFKTRGEEGGEDVQKGQRAHFFLTCSGGMEVPCNKIWM